MAVQVLDHPLAKHLLARLRDERTEPADFRRAAHNLTVLLVLQATHRLRTETRTVATPIRDAQVETLAEGIAAVPVLRAGLAMVQPVTDLFPDVAVGYIGLQRNEETARAYSYYQKLPNLDGRLTLVLDPMLATGGSAAQAVSFVKAQGATRITMVSVVASRTGVERLSEVHPDVTILTAAIDPALTDRAYIDPGLGDFGDRLYGTFG